MTAASPASGLASPINGRYRIDAEIARGGMGVVYKCTDLTLGRAVAVKVLQASADDDDEDGGDSMVARFRREAESLAKLNHRNIVTIFDYGETDGWYFLAMEYVEGAHLAKLTKEEPLDPKRAIGLMIQVAQAMKYAHAAGIVHRDIKPENILVRKVDSEEVVKVVDFGLVHLAETDKLTAHGLILGSVSCMSPEQIKGEDIDERADIYAMGIVLFKILVGEYPFSSSLPTEAIAAHLHAPVPEFRAQRPELVVPHGIEGVVRRCLEKRPEDRYQTVEELLDDLTDCYGVPPSDFVSVTMYTYGRPPRRSPLLRLGLPALLVVMLGILGVLLLAVIGQVAWDVFSPQPDPEPEPSPAVVQPVPEPVEDPPVLPEPDPEPQLELVPVAVPDPEPQVAAPAPRPDPAPVKPRPRPTAAPEPAPEPEPRVEPKPDPKPQAAVFLDDIKVDKAGDEVRITLEMSSKRVRPLHFAVENGSPSYPKQYRVTFRGGASAMGTSTVPVGHALLDSVTIVEGGGNLAVIANSKGSPKMSLSGSGPTYTILVRE